jgi:hypothetical protein
MDYSTKQRKARVVKETRPLIPIEEMGKSYEVRGSGKYYYPEVQQEVLNLRADRAEETDLSQGGAYTGAGMTRKIGGRKPARNPILKSMEDEILSGSGFLEDFKSGFDMVMKPVANIAKAVVPGASPVLGLLGYGKRQKRGQLIKQIMRNRGVSLGEASRIIKEENLM